MPNIKFSGPVPYRVSGFLALNRIAVSTYLRRAGKIRRGPQWDANLEIGVQFWRRQFTLAMAESNISKGRQILDAVQTETPDIYAVDYLDQSIPKGRWYIPHQKRSNATVLYFHGGGYAFHGAMSIRFAAMLAHHIGAPVFAPDYRLTPEHPHPAQAEDAWTAWKYITTEKTAGNVVVIGDSAGGHMMLSLLLSLRNERREQPALGIGLCPWTDIGDRGASLYENDKYDLVQSWMALEFGKWLDPHQAYGREALSPISHDFKGLAPLYLQAGGREILRDMIKDFVEKQAQNGSDIMLDIWPDMPHDFQLLDSTELSASSALIRISEAVHCFVDGPRNFRAGPMTEAISGFFSEK